MTKKKNIRLITSLVATVAAVLAVAGAQGIVLKHRAKAGDVAEYAATASFDTDQGAISFTQKRSEKVSEVKPDGSFVMQVSTSDTKVEVNGQEVPAQAENTGSVEIGPDGLVTAIKSDPGAGPEAWRISNLHAFKAPDAPVKVGDEIKFTIPADKTKSTPSVSADYKVDSLEKVGQWDTVKLTYSNEETEGDSKSSIKGTLWLSTADGTIVKAQEEWKNVQPPGVPFPLSGKYNVTRTK